MIRLCLYPKGIQNPLIKVAISLGLGIGSIPISSFGILLCGTFAGMIVNPTSQHEHNYYACACDEALTLTEPQAICVGLGFFIAMLIGLLFITRYLKFSKWG